MKDRIIKVMETEGLTPAKFAEAIDAQRATISHILSGRNNASLEITVKILDRFPKLSSDWLLRGTGDMYVKGKPKEQQDLFGNTLAFPEKALVAPEPRKEIESRPPVNVTHISSPESVTVFATPEKPSRRVTKIMIFYSDNTYDTFISEKTPLPEK
ncbi:hypothetical protein Barb6_02624 [Bacteroidales bacterium Barb6]|nr:hypothetical protein Barb6_02624 [Bacteroidales bacterium Barb6]